MARFAIEHLPRATARYQVTPMSVAGTRVWIADPDCTSLIRTTELIDAIEQGLGTRLQQSDVPVELGPGDEAVLIYLSFGVLLAFAEGSINPLPEDWRCSLLVVEPTEDSPEIVPFLAVADPLPELLN